MFTETLRKYPIIPILDRKCCMDYELPAPNGNGTVTLPAGTGVYIPLLGLHYDPTYYPDPEKFDPDRFTEENKHSRPNCTYIPFGEGPRMCIGKVRHWTASCKKCRFQALKLTLSFSATTPFSLVVRHTIFLLKNEDKTWVII
jgi:hypothetical protein